MRVAICPGSFDPVTYGHLDVIKRATRIFDRVYVTVLNNPTKNPLFTVEERLDFLRRATAHLENTVCEYFEGLLVDYARQRKAVAMVRGLRAVSDFESEFKMASMNRNLNPDVETIFMMTSGEYAFLSSSIVREVASYGGDVSKWVPGFVAVALQARLQERNLERSRQL